MRQQRCAFADYRRAGGAAGRQPGADRGHGRLEQRDRLLLRRRSAAFGGRRAYVDADQASKDGTSGFHSFIGLATAGIAFSTATPTLVVAAFSTSAQGGIVGAVTSDSFPGLYYSNDAGMTWQMATIQDGTSFVQRPQPLGTGDWKRGYLGCMGPGARDVLRGGPVARLLFFAQRNDLDAPHHAARHKSHHREMSGRRQRRGQRQLPYL